MAGLWDIVRGDVGELGERINISLLETELTAFALGVKTQAEARTVLETSLGRSFTTNELTDLSNIATQFTTGNTTQRLVYAHKIGYALNAAELELIDEASWRSASVLNIPDPS